MVIVHSFEALQETFEARASEWALTAAILSLAFVFFMNGHMYVQPEFSGLRDIINSQAVWAWIFLLIGSTRLMVLLINGMYWRTPHFRAITAFLSTGVWFLFCVGFARNGDILIALMPWVFFLDAYNTKRAAREAGKSEYIQQYLKKKQDRTNAGFARKPHT